MKKPSLEPNGVQPLVPWTRRVDTLSENTVSRKRFSKRVQLKVLEADLKRERETRERIQEEWNKEKEIMQAERAIYHSYFQKQTTKMMKELERKKEEMGMELERELHKLMEKMKKEFERERELIRMEREKMREEFERGRALIRMEREKMREEFVREREQMEKERKMDRAMLLVGKVDELKKETEKTERLEQTEGEPQRVVENKVNQEVNGNGETKERSRLKTEKLKRSTKRSASFYRLDFDQQLQIENREKLEKVLAQLKEKRLLIQAERQNRREKQQRKKEAKEASVGNSMMVLIKKISAWPL